MKTVTRELDALLKKNGFGNVEEAVGTSVMESIDVKQLRDFMTEVILEKFSGHQTDQTSEIVSPAPPNDSTAVSDGTEGSDDALQAHYYSIPPSHFKKKKSPGIAPTS